jgi:hypothetical protein
VDSLFQFFTDEGDWAYVMGYEECGIVAAQLTHTGEDDVPLQWKRIVIQLRCGTMYSVIRMDGITPPGCWKAARLTQTGDWVGEEPEHYTTYQLFETFKRHAQS